MGHKGRGHSQCLPNMLHYLILYFQVPESILKCQRAGITVRMVTGDNVETAKSIAEKCGIIPKGNKGYLVLDGPTFRKKVMQQKEDGTETVNLLRKICESIYFRVYM